ncbi:transporter substrate-binding domain-containing protein [Duganella sp. BJB1802]|uniref:substrate-binding periplasmic protein n=1 Tax=Duganella sp. BJB1802 TaxID=2744575 RepID=UPI001593D922|nr:transporter substrate-binding domain-containing protein [Duganella sp. BJB1802]NVD71583.1 transporter substrate-binding domain-containing protein [Duganella sp. BJB1802]
MRCILLLMACLLGVARSAELVVMVDSTANMPMARVEDGRLVDGVHKDIGEILARHMGRRARFVMLPRKRLERALQNGEADLLCAYMPEWLGGDYLWSRVVFTTEEVLVTDASVPPVRALGELRGRPVGTILGYFHPEMEALLGKDFVRDNAPNMESNMAKLGHGRVHHILITRVVLDYYQRLRQPPLLIHPPLPVMSFATRCAVSRKGHVALREIDQAIGRAARDGSLAAMLTRFR